MSITTPKALSCWKELWRRLLGAVEHDYETSLDAIDRSLALSPSSTLAFGIGSIIRAWKGDESAALADLGREAEAAAGARHLLELRLGSTIASLVESEFARAEHIAVRAERLRRSRLSEER